MRFQTLSWFTAFAIHLAALSCPAHANPFTDLFFPSQSEPAAVGAWHTTVTRAATVAALDPAWTPSIVARGVPRVTTGSIAQVDPRAALPGPRLTGDAHDMQGVASYYWEDQMTATGEQFDKRAMTAAHKTLPFGTKVRVTRVDTGKAVVVRINDRGPYKPGRIIDLSESAAESLGMTDIGTTPVRLDVLGQ